MARLGRNPKKKKSLKQNRPSRIRIVYDDPDATESSGDERGVNPLRKRSVLEYFLVASHGLSAFSSVASFPSISGHHRSTAAGFRPWVSLQADETDAGEPSEQLMEGERSGSCSAFSAADDGNFEDRGCEAFMSLSPSSVLDVPACQSEVPPAAMSLAVETTAIGLPEPASDDSFGLFWFESCVNPVEWAVDFWFGSSTVEWASTAEVEKFFAN